MIKNDTTSESAVNICVYDRADWAEHSSYVRFGFSLRCVVMEMFSPSPVDACVFIRLISLAELAAFEADTQTGERKVKDSNRTRNEWKGEELNPKKGNVDSLQLKFSENDADIVFWQVFCRLNDGAATKWLLSSVWTTLTKVVMVLQCTHSPGCQILPFLQCCWLHRVVSFGVLAGASAAIMDGKRQRSSFRELQCQR